MRGLATKRDSVSRGVRLRGRIYGVGGRWRGGGGGCVAFGRCGMRCVEVEPIGLDF